MTALSCFLIAVGVMTAAGHPEVRQGPMVHVLVATVLLIAFTTLFLDFGHGVLQTMGRDPTLTGRTEVWNVALRYAGDPLLGTGFESFWLGERLEKIWNIYWWHPNEAHNGYLEVFLNLGLMGIVLLATLVGAGYRNVIRALRRDPEAGSFNLGYFVAALAYNFTEAAIRTFQPVWVIFLLTTFAVPDAGPRIDMPGASPSEPRGEL
jgi:O-antigen ligase